MSERTAGASAPFGKEIRNAMDVFLQIAQREGFSVHDFDGYAVDARLGEGDDYIGVLAHLDVVEAGERSHWHGDPFQMQEIDGMLYGRGVNDDKGPLLAAFICNGPYQAGRSYTVSSDPPHCRRG